MAILLSRFPSLYCDGFLMQKNRPFCRSKLYLHQGDYRVGIWQSHKAAHRLFYHIKRNLRQGDYRVGE